MSAYRVEWTLKITADTQSHYDTAVAKVEADAARRLTEFGEEWQITKHPLLKMVEASVVSHVDDVDAAG